MNRATRWTAALAAVALVAWLVPGIALAEAPPAGGDATKQPASDAGALVGVWVSGEGKGRVEIARRDGKYEGVIVWLREPDYPEGDDEAAKPKRDRNNPDERLRSRPILGLKVLEGFTYDGDGTWSGGTIYDPENGKTYKCRIKLKDPDTLDVRGFIGISLIGRSTEWTRYVPESDDAKADAGEQGEKRKNE